MKVCVIGAGVVGCATAYLLCNQGHEVVLVDAKASPGEGASFANGGQLSYSYVEPLASPATLRALPAMLLDKDSPLRWRPTTDMAQWTWGLQFLAACTSRQAERGTHRLLAMAELSRSTLEAWMARDALDFNFTRNGKLVLCPDAPTLERQRRQLALQAYTGVEQRLLNREQCLAVEPALASYSGFVGGVWTPGECAGDPRLFCLALVAAAQKRGLQCVFDAPVQAFAFRQKHTTSVETTKGRIEADAFVLATGAQAPVLARQLGERLPIYPIKGYSLTLKMQEGASAPHTNVTSLAEKMVLAPLKGHLRVAAMAEIVGHDLDIAPATLERIRRAVDKVYPGVCDMTELKAWSGLRPATPSSVPIIRKSRVRNVVLNLGHGALGFTLSAGSAALAAQHLNEGVSSALSLSRPSTPQEKNHERLLNF
jgi:D-amino-acid dehydrogenase